MKIYISVPMTGIPDFNKPALNAAETKLKLKGYTVLSPACLPSSEEITHDEYMLIDLAMLKICDAIYMLEGWENSKGAKMEYQAAVKAGMIIIYEKREKIIMKLKKEFARLFKSAKYGQVLVFIDYSKENKPIIIKWNQGSKSCNMKLEEENNENLDEIFDKMDLFLIDPLIEDINNRHPDTEEA